MEIRGRESYRTKEEESIHYLFEIELSMFIGSQVSELRKDDQSHSRGCQGLHHLV